MYEPALILVVLIVTLRLTLWEALRLKEVLPISAQLKLSFTPMVNAWLPVLIITNFATDLGKQRIARHSGKPKNLN